MSMIWMTHAGVVGSVQIDQQAFSDIWSGLGWVEVAGPVGDPGVRTVLLKGDVTDGQTATYDASTGFFVPTDPLAASLPTGGTTNQVITKQADGSVAWSDGVPGPAGPDGLSGPPGRDGQNGTDGGLDAAALRVTL